MDSFETSLDRKIQVLARTQFGISYLRPFQQLAIRNVLERVAGDNGEIASLLVVLPTGSGKSICFQLPALLSPGITIVVYPLLSLMNDQSASLTHQGIPSIMLKGGQTKQERMKAWNDLDKKAARIIITNPETLISKQVQESLSGFDIDLFVVDEAHTVCEWGKSFRPAYLGLAGIIKELRPKQVVAFTATASTRIMEGLSKLLFDGQEPHVILGSPDRPNIRYHVRRTLCPEHDVLMLILRGIPRPAIIFCPTRRDCEALAWLIAAECRQVPVQYYHAGQTKPERIAVENWFRASNEGILCATTAYGMGVDKRNIRTIIHLELPQTAEAYLQESGRAGRDGAQADAWVLLGLVPKRAVGRRSRLASLFESHDQCYREGLLRLMDVGIDQDFCCSGCDICDGYRYDTAEGREELTGIIRRHPFRFEVEELAWLVGGERIQPVTKTYDKLDPSYGILRNWSFDHLCVALENIRKSGDIAQVMKGPFKGRLYTPRSHRTVGNRRALPHTEPYAYGSKPSASDEYDT